MKRFTGFWGHHRREIPCEAQPASPYRQVFQNFSDHLRLGTPLMAEGREGLGAVTLTNAAYLSSWLDRRIQFPIDEKRTICFLYSARDRRKMDDEWNTLLRQRRAG